jgi:hypothetical protein
MMALIYTHIELVVYDGNTFYREHNSTLFLGPPCAAAAPRLPVWPGGREGEGEGEGEREGEGEGEREWERERKRLKD